MGELSPLPGLRLEGQSREASKIQGRKRLGTVPLKRLKGYRQHAQLPGSFHRAGGSCSASASASASSSWGKKSVSDLLLESPPARRSPLPLHPVQKKEKIDGG